MENLGYMIKNIFVENIFVGAVPHTKGEPTKSLGRKISFVSVVFFTNTRQVCGAMLTLLQFCYLSGWIYEYCASEFQHESPGPIVQRFFLSTSFI